MEKREKAMEIKQKITRTNFTDRNSLSRIKYLVIHYVGAVSSARNNADFFYSTYRGASAHYFVDEEEIWQVVADEDIAWHCGTSGAYKHSYCRNDNSIGIEMCCKKNSNGNWYFEQNTIRNCIALAKQIVNKYKIPVENVLRHYDVTGKICPEPYIRNIELWNDFKKEVFKKEEYTMNTEIPQWKVECVKWLEKEGLISQNHKPDEPIDMGSLGAVLINLFEKYYITKK